MPIYEGDGTALNVSEFHAVYEGDGTTLWESGLADGAHIYTASQFSSLRRYDVSQPYTAYNLDNTETIASIGAIIGDIVWKPDGAVFYELDQNDDIIYQRDTDVPFSLENATESGSHQLTVATGDPNVMEWASGGGKLFVLEPSGVDARLHEYHAGTNWDITTLSHEVDVSVAGSYPGGLAWNDDGTRVHIMNTSGSSPIREYTLSTAFDITTMSSTGEQYTPALVGASNGGLVWSNDGLRLWYAMDGPSGFGTVNLDSSPFDLSDVVGESALGTIHAHSPSSITFNGAHPHLGEYEAPEN